MSLNIMEHTTKWVDLNNFKEDVKKLKKEFCICKAFKDLKQCPRCDFINKIFGYKLI